ncbi:MAG: asparagine synthase (glutamine-hydrolyzing) [Candidatus Pacebacteria bacterium]|nr:asparagine synthase (glutamine-hydrolyzing) [Candidatus Paceibacterota bacterium]
MCGIVGIASKNKILPAHYDTQAMLDSLSKRGPDGYGEHRTSSAWLGHRRLSIIDLGGGGQPMHDEELTIVFNGEIYSYRELREKLEKRGHTFKTHSDTEVILKAYREYGQECPKHLDGMFAFAIWDDSRQTLFMARDRFGKKPLYYALDGDTIVFASEIKAILASGKIKGTLSREALDNYLRLMYIPPWKSIYKNIAQVPAAHSAQFKDGKLLTTRYWKLEFNPIDVSYEEAKKEVRRLLDEAVKKRMLAADVEVGSFLSGGVDSTIVSILAQNYLDHPLKTFSLGYGDYINELPYAEQASKKIGSEHYTLQASGDNIEELENVIAYFDEPHADNSDFPQHLLSQMTASKVKVALSGDGGDEIFMGYGWHTRHKNLSYRAHTFEKTLLNAFQGRVRAQRIFPPLLRAALWMSPFRLSNKIFDHGAYAGALTPMQKIFAFDLTTYLPGQLLSKVDRASMMHGLEVRCPFLDTALVEYVVNLPEEFKSHADGQKYLLKDLLSEYMPKEFVNRRKQGFGAPTTKWLREEKIAAYAQKMLGKDAAVRSLLSGTVIDIILHRFYKKNKNNDSQRIWILLCLEIWLRKAKPII